MPTKSAPDLTTAALIPEDVAHLADASGEHPDATAARLQAFIRCNHLKQVEDTWRLIGTHLEALNQMAEDAGVELLVDGIYIFRLFERLRSEHWKRPEDLHHPGVDVPYEALISMAGAHARRAEGDKKAELEALIVALGHHHAARRGA